MLECDSIFDDYENNLKEEIESAFSEMIKKIKDYEHNKNVTTFLKSELEKRGLKFIGEDVPLRNIIGEECRPDLVFLCESDFGILLEVKSSLPIHHDFLKEGELIANMEKKDEYFNMFVKKMLKKKNCFKKLNSFEKHEIIFVVHDHDKHKFSEMIFPPNTREELTFFLAKEYNFQLWYWVIQKDKKDKEMIKVESVRRTESACKELDIYPYLRTRSQDEFIYATELVKFIRLKPPIEYTMSYILMNIQGQFRRSIDKSEFKALDEQVWKSAEEIHRIILDSHESLSGAVPRIKWIKEALEELVELGYIDKKQEEEDQYGISLSGRWAPKTIYEDFVEKQILNKYDLLKRRVTTRKRVPIEQYYIPNATYNQIRDIVLKVYQAGGIISK